MVKQLVDKASTVFQAVNVARILRTRIYCAEHEAGT